MKCMKFPGNQLATTKRFCFPFDEIDLEHSFFFSNRDASIHPNIEVLALRLSWPLFARVLGTEYVLLYEMLAIRESVLLTIRSRASPRTGKYSKPFLLIACLFFVSRRKNTAAQSSLTSGARRGDTPKSEGAKSHVIEAGHCSRRAASKTGVSRLFILGVEPVLIDPGSE